MTAPSAILAGMQITAAMIRGVAPLSATKAGNQQSVTTTIVSDNALFVPVPANTSWSWIAAVGYNGAGFTGSGIVGGLADAWNLPANATGQWWCLGYGSGASMVLNLDINAAGAGSPNHNTNNPSTNLPLVYLGSAVIGNTPGNIQYAWGQATVDAANPTTVLAGSMLLAWQTG